MKFKDCLETLFGVKDTPFVFVFDNLDEATNWIESQGNTSAEPLFVLKQGVAMAKTFLKEDLCETRVTQIFAIRENRFVIVLNDEG